MIKEITTNEELLNEINNTNNKYIIVDFYTETCQPCKMIFAQLDILENELDDVLILKVNGGNAIDMVTTYSVMSVPTLLYFNNGEIINRSIGYLPADLIKHKLFNK